MRKILKAIFLLVLINPINAQNVDSLIERIYQQNAENEAKLSETGDYRFKQVVEFIKFDGDDEIEEQSYREFEVLVKQPDVHKRILVSARDFEDGEWQDVTEERKNSQERGESKEFSLNEMVGPESRNLYRFTYLGRELLGEISVEHIKAQVIEPDEDRFNGDLWFDAGEFNILKARLVPSDFPTGVDSMLMDFEMQQVNGFWMPAKIHLEAEISFLFFFSGKIQSDIIFSDYEFDQKFEDEIFQKSD